MDKVIKSRIAKILFTSLLVVFFVPRGVSLPSLGLSVRQVRLDKSSNYNLLYSRNYSGLLLGRAYAQDGAEYLVFGPYVSLSPGKYEIAFTLQVADNKISQPIATIDVVAEDAHKVFASQTLKGTDFKSPNTYQDFNLPFDTTLGARDFEFRIRYFGGSKLWAEKIGITRLQSYSKEEAVGGDLIKGYTKDNIVTEAESFLKRSRHRKIKIDDRRLGHKMGYLVSDSKAFSGQAWLVEPWMLKAEAPPAGPWKISLPQIRMEPSVLFILGLITGGIFVLVGVFAYRRGSPSVPSPSPPSGGDKGEGDDTQLVLNWAESVAEAFRSPPPPCPSPIEREADLKVAATEKWKAEVFRYITKKHLVVLIVLAGIILSLFFEEVSIFGISTLGGYLIVLYIILSLVWRMDSRISIAVALLFLVSCPFFLIFGQEQLAERAAVYAYYFLVIWVFFQFKEYLVESKAERKEEQKETKEALPAESIPVPQELVAVTSNARYRIEQLRRKKRGDRGRMAAIIVIALFVGGIFVWANLPGKPRVNKQSPTSEKVIYREKSSISKLKKKLSLEKADLKIQVLNGNGLQGEAATIGDLLKSGGFNIIGTENADNFDYSETIIRYKSRLGKWAGLVRKQIAGSYLAILQDNLPSDYGVDIEIILGRKAQ